MNFVLMEEQLARAKRFVVPWAAGQVLRNVRVNEPSAAGLEIDISVTNIRFPFAQGLYFGAVQDQTGLKAVEQMEIIRSGAVLGHDLLASFAVLLRFLCRLRHNPPS